MPRHSYTPKRTDWPRFWAWWFRLHALAGLGLLVMVREAMERARGWW